MLRPGLRSTVKVSGIHGTAAPSQPTTQNRSAHSDAAWALREGHETGSPHNHHRRAFGERAALRYKLRRFGNGSSSNDDAPASRPAACGGRGGDHRGRVQRDRSQRLRCTGVDRCHNHRCYRHQRATIKGFSFQPDVVKVKVGAKVTWTNDDTVAHTVTADTNSFASGNLQPGGSFSFTFTRPGTYAYHCSIHPSMHGSVVVG